MCAKRQLVTKEPGFFSRDLSLIKGCCVAQGGGVSYVLSATLRKSAWSPVLRTSQLLASLKTALSRWEGNLVGPAREQL